MEINTSVQLGVEQALKALIPYLQARTDAEGRWDFLDVFPGASSDSDFLFLAGHEAKTLPDDKTAFLAFIASLPDYRTIGYRYPNVTVRMELATAGIADQNTREEAVVTHSRRSAALIRLFSPRYYEVLREVLNTVEAPDNRPWKGLGFDAWNAEPPQGGQSPTGTAFVASPSYIFVVHFEAEPQI